MFHIYHSNRVENLLAVLIQKLATEGPSNPFESETVLVQNTGMAHWLKVQIAQTMGIAMNIEFPMPSRFLWDQIRTVLTDLPKESPYSKQAMTWQLFDLLDELKTDPEFNELTGYWTQHQKDLGRYRLAAQIADLYDQYLIYRVDWILGWERQTPEAELEGMPAIHLWQGKLWRLLKEKIEQKYDQQPHRATLPEQFVASLGSADRSQFPKRIFIFGISALAPAYLDMINGLAKKVDVHLFLMNPSYNYWGDIKDERTIAKVKSLLLQKLPGSSAKKSASNKLEVEDDSDVQVSMDLFATNDSDPELKTNSSSSQSVLENEHLELGNPLLASWGKLGRDYLELFHQYDLNDQDYFIDHPTQSMLEYIQQDVLHLKDGRKQVVEIQEGDHSISVHKHFSKLREVEGLHNQILDWLNHDKNLEPKDIIVMVPDINDYAPYFNAVFGSYHDERAIPWSISDRSSDKELPLIEAYLGLIKVAQSRIKQSELFAILEVPAVLKKFGISEEGFKQIKTWLIQAGFRWSLDGSDKAKFGLPVDFNFSLIFALKRLLLSYASNQSLFADIAPLEQVTGQEVASLGLFVDFVEQLIWLLEALEQEQTLSQWLSISNQVLERFFEAGETEQAALEKIRKCHERLYEELALHKQDIQVSSELFGYWMEQSLTSADSSQHFMIGRVNVCTLLPMRSIPFKKVCLIGMNDSDYPRQVVPNSMDLMEHSYRLGDRSRRDDDRFLFLEALLSGRESLYLSYRAWAERDGANLTPSVLLAELLDYMNRRFKVASGSVLDSITLEHPLQPFSEKYFDPANRLYSYHREWLSALGYGESFPIEQLDSKDHSDRQSSMPVYDLPVPDSLDIDQLVKFFLNPVRGFWEYRFQVRLRHFDDGADDHELFNLDALASYNLKQRALTNGLSGASEKSSFDLAVASGTVPSNSIGLTLYEQDNKKVNGVLDRAQAFIGERLDDQPVYLELNGITLEGKLDQLFSEGRVSIRVSSVKPKDQLELWIRHLVLNAIDSVNNLSHQNRQDQTLNRYSVHIGEDKIFKLKPMEKNQARQLLMELLALFKQGLQSPLCFLPELASKWFGKQGEQDVLTYLTNDNQYSQFSEAKDLYFKRSFTDHDFIVMHSKALANKIWLPMADFVDDSQTEAETEAGGKK